MKPNIQLGEIVEISVVQKGHYQMHDCTRYSNFALMRSVKKHGQLRPIITDQNFQILDGNRIFDIMLRLEHKQVWILRRQTDNGDRGIAVVMNLRTVFDKVRPETVYSIVKKNKEVLNFIPYPRAQMERWTKDMESVEFDKAA